MFIVTGAGSGIGRALTHALATRGFPVMAVGRRQAFLTETADFSPLIQTCCADVSQLAGRERVVAALGNIQNIAGVIHNAGTLHPITSLFSMDEAAWQQTLETNLNAPLFLTKQLMSTMRLGRVLHIGSGAAYFPIKGWAAYCVSKAALSMLTRCWQEETTNSPVFASVMPGIVDTDMQGLARHGKSMAPEKVAFFEQLYQENRLLTPDVVASFLTWL